MSELYGTSETSDTAPAPADADSRHYDEPAQADDLTRYEETLEGDDYTSYDDGGTLAAEEDGLPTRQEAWEQTWGEDPEYDDESDLATLYDGDASTLAAEEEGLPTRQEAREQTWGDESEHYDENELAAGYEGDTSTLAAEEEGLPTRQEAWHETWGAAAGTQDPPSPDATREAETPDSDVEIVPTDEVTVHDQYGHDVPLTVVHGAPEGPALGNGAPTDIGLKPTGEQLLEMESEAESWKEAFRNEIHREAEEITDVAEKWGDLGARLCERPPTTTHSEVPTGQPVLSMPEHHGVEGDQVAIAMFTVGLVGFEAYRKVSSKISDWRRGDKHDRN